MEQDEQHDSLPRITLLRRAHELLESVGQPVEEALLVKHLFGVQESAGGPLWTALLRQTLQSSALFIPAQNGATAESCWSLAAWQRSQLSLASVDFVVIDTETTGLRPGADRVIELAAVRVRDGIIQDSFQSLVNPGRRIPAFITKFTGIAPEMLVDAPRAQEIFPGFLQFIEGATLVGHNVSFDLNFLTHEAHLLGLTFPAAGLDTIPLARRFLPGLKRFKLDQVAAYLQIPTVNRHRALGDAQVTAEVFLRMLEQARLQGIVTLDHLQRRLQLPVAWSGDITQAPPPGKGKQKADRKLSSSSLGTTQPNGNLYLNAAWKRTFPEKPGVYLMKDKQCNVIYVGKAKNLKNRLSSYYSHPLGYKDKVAFLIQDVHDIETRVLGSELEALLEESRLIKEFKPHYNVQLLNYELYPFIKVDIQHQFPRVFATRDVLDDGARYFGPFRSRRLVDLTIELVQKIFPIRTCLRTLPPEAKPSEPCLRSHLGRCSAPCRGDDDAEAYQAMIKDVCAFLGGEQGDLLDRLRYQMHEASHQLNYERAAWYRNIIRSADEVLIGQRLISGAVEANNLFIVYPSSQNGYNEIFLIRHGRLVERRCVVHQQADMLDALSALLEVAARLGEPPAVVGKAEVDQINIISRWLHHHSAERAFFPFQQVLIAPGEAETFLSQVWTTVEQNRAAALSVTSDGEEEEILFLCEEEGKTAAAQ